MHLPPPPTRTITKISEVYLDESSQTKHRFLVLGCLVTTPEQIARFEEEVWAARQPELPAGEMKWTKVSTGKFEAYRKVANAFFRASQRDGGPHFHALVVDTKKINDRAFNEGSREIGFNKEVYQLLIKMGRLYRDTLFHVYPDRRATGNNPDELRLILNRGLKAKSNDSRDWPYRRVHWRNSEDSISIQVVDVLIGALAFQLNGHHLAPDASPAKSALAKHIIAMSPITDVMRSTAISGRFTLWHRQLREVGSPSPRP